MYLSLFYSLIFELVFFGTVPPFLSLLGAFIIIVSAVWVAVCLLPFPQNLFHFILPF